VKPRPPETRRPGKLLLRRSLLAGVLLGLSLSLGATLSLWAQGMRPPPPRASAPPFDLKDEAVVTEGARMFQQNCTGYCHGREGRVARAPKLRGRQFEPAYLYERIANGFPPMPSYRTILADEQIWKLVAYIMSLADKEE